jgi:hypothetical protein
VEKKTQIENCCMSGAVGNKILYNINYVYLTLGPSAAISAVHATLTK